MQATRDMIRYAIAELEGRLSLRVDNMRSRPIEVKASDIEAIIEIAKQLRFYVDEYKKAKE